MKHFAFGAGIALALGLGAALALLGLLDSARPVSAASPARATAPLAAPAGGVTRYVAITGTDGGNDCTDSADPCRTVQHAVDQPGDGDEILVAGGVYTGVSVRNTVTQVLYVSETVVVRGGYDTGFATRDPDVYTTTLDARGQGQVVRLQGAVPVPITVTLEGVWLTGGSADYGGGLRIGSWTYATISNCQVYSNTAGQRGGGINLGGEGRLVGNHVYGNTAQDGGGVYVSSDGSTLAGNRVHGNHASGSGGGLYFSSASDARLAGNDVYSNTAYSGGGLFFANSPQPTLSGNRVYSNAAGHSGGGIYLAGGHDGVARGNDVYANRSDVFGGGFYLGWNNRLEMTDNRVYSNTSNTGGGFYVGSGADVVLEASEVFSNSANGNGGGVYVGADGVTLAANRLHGNVAFHGGGVHFNDSAGSTLVNNVVVENRSTSGGAGPGVYVYAADVRLLHTTIARNSGGDGSGVYVGNNGADYGTAELTNTVIASQAIGIYVKLYSTATLEATLWGDGAWDNGSDWSSYDYVFTGTTNLWADPAFEDADSGDYHITYGSLARDAGVDAGVADDVDGDSRLLDAQPDVGADEYGCHVRVGSTDYAGVQAAVDDAGAGSEVMVAVTCRGVETRGSYVQLAYISKTVTVRGGYGEDFGVWDPQTYPTTLDAEGGGHVVVINGTMPGSITPTLEALHVTGGRSSQGGAGVYSRFADTVISGCHVYSNTATQNQGGGLLVEYGPRAILTANRIHGNVAVTGLSPYGGGLYIRGCDQATLAGNQLTDNEGTYGGGAVLYDSDATLLNNVFADNLAGETGGGLYVLFCSPRLLHTTIARNGGGDGSGVYVKNGTVALTNTVIVGHAVAVSVTAGSTATLESTLWGEGAWANGADWGGAGAVASTRGYTGAPGFVDPDGGDYHLALNSAAVDKGIDAGILTDIDGESRVGVPDLGADELVMCGVYLPLVLRSY